MAMIMIISSSRAIMENRIYSRYTREAALLLGKQIRLGRKQRKWTEQELAERANISRATLRKIEQGELSVTIGLVLEAAALVGVKLFDPERTSLDDHLARADDKLALLPRAVRQRGKAVDDDF